MVLLLAPVALAEVPEGAAGGASRIELLQAQVNAKVLAFEGIGNFTYSPRSLWEEGVKVAPCAPASPPFLAAELDLSAVDNLVTSATSKAPLENLHIQLERLASQPCFATAASLPSFDSVESLQTYWSQGGRLAFTTALNVETARSYVIPADPRRSVAELVVEHPRLARFVCTAPGSCARETRWKDELEAERRLISLQLLLKSLESQSTAWRASEKRCALAAATAPRDLQFLHWRDCIERTSHATSLLPRGNLHTVEAGWLFLRVETRKEGVSGYLAVNLATAGALRMPRGFVCGSDPTGAPDGEISSCGESYTAPVRLQLSIQRTRRLAWELLMQAGSRIGRPDSTIAKIPDGVSATSVAPQPLGLCLGTGDNESMDWALADRSGALIATGAATKDAFLAQTQLRYEALLTEAPPPEPLRKGQVRWWPKTSQLLREAWGDSADPNLLQVLNQLEASW